MSHVAISVENLSKSYLIGHQVRQRERYTALRDVIAREVQNFVRKGRHFIGGRQIVQGDEVEQFWALRDVSFEVNRGEVLGIIGRNGAGKSTLLKILSRITEPDRGRAVLRGRVASLLEVGTGFHPELTGRENIFLNGAILGMTGAEIKAKFDDIVEFAAVEQFLDTPVKRYSSGMYVRLAFSVAAHLEPDILVVDEVLAVGDAEFQKKCLNKIGEVTKGGRTVLFVSHNMAAVQSLTTRAILLEGGRVTACGTSGKVIEAYMRGMSSVSTMRGSRTFGAGAHTAIQEAYLVDENGFLTTQYTPGECLRLKVIFKTDGTRGLSLELFMTDATGSRLGLFSSYQFHGQAIPEREGRYCVTLSLGPFWLASGKYGFDVATSIINTDWDHKVEAAVEFDVAFSNALGEVWDFKQSYGYGSLTLLSTQLVEFVHQ